MKKIEVLKMLESLERDEQGYYRGLNPVIDRIKKNGQWTETCPESWDSTIRVELEDGDLEISNPHQGAFSAFWF